MTKTLLRLKEIQARLPQERPYYLMAGLVEQRLDAVEADDLDGKLLGLADFLRAEWLPALEIQTQCIKAWKTALEDALPDLAALPKEDRRESVAAFRAEILKIRQEDEAEVRPLMKDWKSEVKATRTMLRQLAPRGKSDPVYQAVKQFMDFTEAQYALLPALSRYMNMFDRKLKKIG